MAVSAAFEQQTVNVEPGGQVDVRLRVRNVSEIVDQITFQAVGIDPSWVVVTPPELRLFPGTEEFVTVSVSPPRSADTPLGQVTFALRVISTEDPGGSVAEELTLVIGSYDQRGGELHPRTSTGRSKGEHQLAIDNFGNTPINPTLAGGDVDGLLSVEIDPPSVTPRSPSSRTRSSGGASRSRSRSRCRSPMARTSRCCSTATLCSSRSCRAGSSRRCSRCSPC